MLKGSYSDARYEAGCDEAGRGCLAGPVFSAAVILPDGFLAEGLDDSKKLSRKQRDRFRQLIEREAVAWSVAMLSNEAIDEINILNASIAAMHEAVKGLSQMPGFLLIDGNRFKPYPGIPHICLVRGDATYLSIAAASVLAKTHRDEFMEGLHPLFPEYRWDRNKGYPTAAHRLAISRFGITPYHRKSFRLAEQLKLFR
jgi:ribonuclease HII